MAIALLIAASDRFDWLVFGVFECNRLVQHERKIVAFLNAEEHGGKRRVTQSFCDKFSS
jgi:hypothetical protein